MIVAVPLARYRGNSTDGMQKMREEFEAKNEGVTIPTKLQ